MLPLRKGFRQDYMKSNKNRIDVVPALLIGFCIVTPPPEPSIVSWPPGSMYIYAVPARIPKIDQQQFICCSQLIPELQEKVQPEGTFNTAEPVIVPERSSISFEILTVEAPSMLAVPPSTIKKEQDVVAAKRTTPEDMVIDWIVTSPYNVTWFHELQSTSRTPSPVMTLEA